MEHSRGRADVPLNVTGLGHAEATGGGLLQSRRNAVKTAEAIAEYFDLPVQVHPGLTMDGFAVAGPDYGQWQGLTPDEAERAVSLEKAR